MIDYEIYREDYLNHAAKLRVHELEAPTWEARLASALVERWGIVAAVPDGEDSAGRSRLRQMTVEELVVRATETAGALVARCRERGWVVELPSLAEIHAHDKIE